MTNTAPNKVVSLSDYDKLRRQISPAESSGLLQECRDLAADLLSKSLGRMLDRIEESLFELAETALNHDVRNLYLEARGKALSHRAQIETEFRRQFVSGFNKKVNPDGKGETQFARLDASNLELSLVDNDDFEASLAASDIAKKFKTNCNDELVGLDRRMAELLNTPDVDDDDNPLGPKAVCNAFKEACGRLESNVNVKLIILKQFDQLVSDDIGAVYKNINTHLISRNVLPVITPELLRRSSAGAAAASAQHSTPSPASAPVSDVDAGPVGGDQELFATLQHLMSRNRGGNQGGFAEPAQGFGATPGSGFAATAGGFPELNAGMLDILTGLQQGNIEAIIADANMAGILAGGALNNNVNILHGLKQSGIGQSANQMDSLTIDIVAMLFDYIFDDRHIPAAMKGLIGRLQIPVLKVAMLDKKFFSRKNHPARRLLDAFASAALGWSEQEREGDRLYAKIEELVLKILSGFDDNLDIFDTVLAEFDAFLQDEEALAEERTEHSAKVIYNREWFDIARTLAEDEVRRRIEGTEMPAVIAQFLGKHWSRLLTQAYAKEGQDSEIWLTGLETMNDLIWSVQPKRAAEERMRLVNMLPNMLKRLERGLEVAATSKDDREAFFSELVRCHAAAIKAGMTSGGQAMELGTHTAEFPQVPTLTDVVDADSVELAPIEFLDAMKSSMKVASSFEHDLIAMANEKAPEALASLQQKQVGQESDDFDRVAARLQRGTWLEFEQEGQEPLRAKLAWISPMKGVYLFTNRQGLNAMSIKLAGLAAKMRAGTARVIEEGALVDRAVTNMLDVLKQGT